MVVKLQNNEGLIKEVKVGFSWTGFFFGAFPFFFRGLPTQGMLWLLGAIFTGGLANIYLMFAINRITAQQYLAKGFKPIGEGWDYAGSRLGVVFNIKDTISR